MQLTVWKFRRIFKIRWRGFKQLLAKQEDRND